MEIGIVRQTKQNAKFFLDDLEDLNSGPRCAELGTMTRKSFVPSKLRLEIGSGHLRINQ